LRIWSVFVDIVCLRWVAISHACAPAEPGSSVASVAVEERGAE
jgi:hypothetical protein